LNACLDLVNQNPNQKVTGRGGPGRGQGRKPNPLKDLQAGTATALKLLTELKAEKEIVELYRNCGDARLKIYILFRLREWAYGKARETIEENVNLTLPDRRDRAKAALAIVSRSA
jgi:hypothetical protein